MNFRRHRKKSILFGIALIGMLVVAGLILRKNEARGHAVATHLVVRKSLQRRHEIPGIVLMQRFVSIPSPVTGRIESISISEGQSIRKGEVLFRVRPEFEDMARLESLRSEAAELRLDLEGLTSELSRRQGTGFSTPLELEKLDTQLRKKQEALRAIERRVAHFRENIGWNEKLCISEVRAPFSGVVTLVNEVSGAAVQGYASANASSGVKSGVLVLTDPSQVVVRSSIAESLLADVQAGMKARVTLQLDKSKTYEGSVKRVSYQGIPEPGKTRSFFFELDVTIHGADSKLRPNLSATVELELGLAREALVLPRSTVLLWNGQGAVVVPGNGLKKIRVGLVTPEYVEVMGMSEGEAAQEIDFAQYPPEKLNALLPAAAQG